VNGPLGAQFLAWEAATALAGRILGINPFDQPNVTESKDNTKKILDSAHAASAEGSTSAGGGAQHPEPLFTDGAVEVHAENFGGATTLSDALEWFVRTIDPTGYLAVMAYLDRIGDAPVEHVRAALARAAGRPVTFGWGPRFLHSTGQYHKGGPANGSFLQITGAVTDDLPVPDRPYTFGQLQAAQAAGDRLALSSRDRPLLWLHLTDRKAGAAQLVEAARALAEGS
jgi:glucose-6-phosphate isomerase